MKSLRQNRDRAMVVGAAVVVAGLLIVCRMTPGCPLAIWSEQRSQPPTGLSGDQVMSNPMQSGGRVLHAGRDDFAQTVLQSEVPVLVDFYADWCGPCQRLAPTLDELAHEMLGAKIVKVNVDESPELAMQYGVSSIPALAVFKDGRITAQHIGLASKDQLKALLRR